MTLNLEENYIGDIGAQHLSKALQHNQVLFWLSRSMIQLIFYIDTDDIKFGRKSNQWFGKTVSCQCSKTASSNILNFLFYSWFLVHNSSSSISRFGSIESIINEQNSQPMLFHRICRMFSSRYVILSFPFYICSKLNKGIQDILMASQGLKQCNWDLEGDIY